MGPCQNAPQQDHLIGYINEHHTYGPLKLIVQEYRIWGRKTHSISNSDHTGLTGPLYNAQTLQQFSNHTANRNLYTYW